jgi:hypothetical protein
MVDAIKTVRSNLNLIILSSSTLKFALRPVYTKIFGRTIDPEKGSKPLSISYQMIPTPMEEVKMGGRMG